jgi:alpha-beta hydrolase superfamily lysophospholipase
MNDTSFITLSTATSEVSFSNSLAAIGGYTHERAIAQKRLRLHVGLPAFLSKKTTINEASKANHVGFAKAYDEEDLYYQIFTPSGNPKAIILVAHGFGEHVGPFENLGVKLAESGYCVVMYDQRGFGRSGGKRGHMKSLQQFLVDCLTVLDLALVLLSDHIGSIVFKLDIFLYGHSTGSLGQLILALEASKIIQCGKFSRDSFLSITKQSKSKKKKTKKDESEEQLLEQLEQYLLTYSSMIRGCISTAPYLRVAPMASELQKKIVKLISKTYKTYAVTIEIPPEKFTSDQKFQRELMKDNLRITDMTVKQLTSWERAVSCLLTESVVKDFNIPLLIIHGGHDVVSDINYSKKFFNLVGTTDKRFDFLFGFLHGLHIEKNRDKVYKSAISWLDLLAREVVIPPPPSVVPPLQLDDGQEDVVTEEFSDDDHVVESTVITLPQGNKVKQDDATELDPQEDFSTWDNENEGTDIYTQSIGPSSLVTTSNHFEASQL